MKKKFIEIQDYIPDNLSFSDRKYNKSSIIYDENYKLFLKIKNANIASNLFLSNYSEYNKYFKLNLNKLSQESIVILEDIMNEIAEEFEPDEIVQRNLLFNSQYNSLSVRIPIKNDRLSCDIFDNNSNEIRATTTNITDLLKKNSTVNVSLSLDEVSFFEKKCFIILKLYQIRILSDGNVTMKKDDDDYYESKHEITLLDDD